MKLRQINKADLMSKHLSSKPQHHTSDCTPYINYNSWQIAHLCHMIHPFSREDTIFLHMKKLHGKSYCIPNEISWEDVYDDNHHNGISTMTQHLMDLYQILSATLRMEHHLTLMNLINLIFFNLYSSNFLLLRGIPYIIHMFTLYTYIHVFILHVILDLCK